MGGVGPNMALLLDGTSVADATLLTRLKITESTSEGPQGHLSEQRYRRSTEHDTTAETKSGESEDDDAAASNYRRRK